MNQSIKTGELPGEINGSKHVDQNGDAVADGREYLVSDRPFRDNDGYLIPSVFESARRVIVKEDPQGDLWVQRKGVDQWRSIEQIPPVFWEFVE